MLFRSMGIIFIFIRSFLSENSAYREPGTYYDSLLFVGFFQTSYLCLTTYALQYPIMTLGRYFIISTFFDLLFSALISIILLYKRIHYLHWIAVGMAALGYVIYDFMLPAYLFSNDYSGNQNTVQNLSS